MPYVLVGDLLGSRRAAARQELAVRVEHELTRLAEAFPDDWRARPVTTKGLDEISGVLARPARAFDIVVELNVALWPNAFRFALGLGEVDVAPQSKDAGSMDGPAFHRAADALERARAAGFPFACALPDVPDTVRDVIEQLARLHATLMSRWTRHTASVVAAYRLAGTQALAATGLGISQQAVSKALRAGHWAEMAGAQDALRRWLETV